jgi:hypothetical protein
MRKDSLIPSLLGIPPIQISREPLWLASALHFCAALVTPQASVEQNYWLPRKPGPQGWAILQADVLNVLCRLHRRRSPRGLFCHWC